MPTHTYMSPEPPLRGAFAPVNKGVRTAALGQSRPASARKAVMRVLELGFIAFTGAAGVWCLYEAVRFFTA